MIWKNLAFLLNLLDSQQSEECIDFSLMGMNVFIFFVSVYNISTRKIFRPLTSRRFSDSKMDAVSEFGRSFTTFFLTEIVI